MKKVRFGCSRCRQTFEIEVFEPGEAQKKGLNAGPVRCLKCGGPVERC